eukprot:TRINITY_DN6090_c0_g1_i2.p1 TRINITY_DN6090_c0_g1~~TRINITY_DN6090_c0_g1_i2.p1  ORF type:complete len:596 (+),score=215.24 TRINITY_DN6090_c0_g1_i2:37-1824(+)
MGEDTVVGAEGQAVNPTEDAGEPQQQEEIKILNLKVLAVIREAQQKHGLRHSDYQRYRGYCSRRLRRLRKALGLVQGEKKKFNKKDVTENVLKDEKHLHIPLVTTERAWAYYMQLKFEANAYPRKKYHMINRLRKARKYAEMLDSLCAESDRVDARTKLETKAYRCWLTGTLFFETSKWSEAQAMLSQAKTIYESLSKAVGEEEGNLFRHKMDEITPSLRYCAYNIGDASAKDDLMSLRGDGINFELDSLITQTREQQAATLQDIEWKGRKMAVKQEKVRIFLLSYQESGQELTQAKESNAAKLSVYENLLLQSKDAVQALREDLLEDPEFRTRQQQSSGKVGSQHFLYTYLLYIRHSITVNRNVVLLETMKRQLEGLEKQEEGKKVVKPQDIVRMYENIIQSLYEVTSLPGLEEDEELMQSNEIKMNFYRAFKSYYMAKAFIFAQKWAEAMAIFHRAMEYIRNVKESGGLDSGMKEQLNQLEKQVEENQFVAHANSILETEQVTEKMTELEINNKAPLVDRLDQYYEDPDLVKGKSNLVRFPPEFEAIPCKPLFFDLAINHLEMPSLEAKLETEKESGKGGLGGWIWGWGGGKK